MAKADRRTLELDRYFPFLLTALSNKWSSSASQLYVKRFGIGVIEWRVLSGAAAARNSRPNDICQMVGIDKGAVAKALRSLERQGLVTTAANVRDGRSKTIQITEAGWALHDQILVLALERQEKLLQPLSADDRHRLLAYLRLLLDRLPSITTSDDAKA